MSRALTVLLLLACGAGVTCVSVWWWQRAYQCKADGIVWGLSVLIAVFVLRLIVSLGCAR